MIDESWVLMAEAIVILPPDMRGQKIVERGDRPPPRHLARGFEPFGMLVHHGIDDMNESIITGEQSMTSREQVALQPTLAIVLAEDLHDATVASKMVVKVEQRL